MGYDLYSIEGDEDMTIGAFSYPTFIKILDAEQGVVDWDVKRDEFVKREDYKDSGERDEDGELALDDEDEPKKEPAYYEADRAMLSKTSPDPNRIAAFKHFTNDGWIITPGECLIIAAAVEKVAEQSDSDGEKLNRQFVEWGAFAKRCAELGGYRVR